MACCPFSLPSCPKNKARSKFKTHNTRCDDFYIQRRRTCPLSFDLLIFYACNSIFLCLSVILKQFYYSLERDYDKVLDSTFECLFFMSLEIALQIGKWIEAKYATYD